MSRDSIGERGGENLYGFTRNNPINLVDRDGRDNHGGGGENIVCRVTIPPVIVTFEFESSSLNKKRDTYIERRRFDFYLVGNGTYPGEGLVSDQPLFWWTGYPEVDVPDDVPPGIACTRTYTCKGTCAACDGRFKVGVPGDDIRVEGVTESDQIINQASDWFQPRYRFGHCWIDPVTEEKQRKKCEKQIKEACRSLQLSCSIHLISHM